jgi:hypothetical protein
MSDTGDSPQELPKTIELEPIENVVRNLQAQGMEKYQIATELKLMGYKVRDIAKSLGISFRDIGTKTKASRPSTPEDVAPVVAGKAVLDTYVSEVGQISQAELIQMVEARRETRYLDDRARDQGFTSTAQYIKIACNFYDTFRPTVTELLSNGNIDLPVLTVE